MVFYHLFVACNNCMEMSNGISFICICMYSLEIYMTAFFTVS